MGDRAPLPPPSPQEWHAGADCDAAGVKLAGRRWLGLMVLPGTIGRFMSEGLSWNVDPLLASADRCGFRWLARGLGATAGSTLLFAIFADQIVRWRVRDATGLVLRWLPFAVVVPLPVLVRLAVARFRGAGGPSRSGACAVGSAGCVDADALPTHTRRES